MERVYKFLAKLIVVGVVVVLVAGPWLVTRIMPGEKEVEFGSSGEFDREAVLETAEQILVLVGQGDAEKLLDEYGAWSSNTTDNVSKVNSQILAVSQDWGAYQSLSLVKLAEVKLEGNSYALVQVEAKYENVTVPVRIYLDPEKKLTGIHFDS